MVSITSDVTAGLGKEKRGWSVERIFPALFVLAIAFLGFVGGALVILSETFPSAFLTNAYLGGRALIDKAKASSDVHRTDFWEPAPRPELGIVTYDPERAYNGLTLYTSGQGSNAYLMSMDGDIVHTWGLPFSSVWDETAAVEDPQPDEFMYWRKAHLFPNGDLLAIYVAGGDTPWGYGLVKVNKDSEVIWKYMKRAHHDLDVAENSNIYVLTHEISFKEHERFLHLKTPRIDDFVVILSPDGKELKKVSILDALIASPYSRLLSRVAWYSKGDFLHTNTVEVLTRETAAGLPFAKEGQVLISFREIDTIAILDVDTKKIVWALRGAWYAQHDPDALPDGKMLLFDNSGHYGKGGTSRVIEFDPLTMEITWQYTGDEENVFQSNIRSAQERLPNGNTLITESSAGRLFEVTRDHEIVWEYIIPHRMENPRKEGEQLVPVVSWGQRVEPDTLDPDFMSPLLVHNEGD